VANASSAPPSLRGRASPFGVPSASRRLYNASSLLRALGGRGLEGGAFGPSCLTPLLPPRRLCDRGGGRELVLGMVPTTSGRRWRPPEREQQAAPRLSARLTTNREIDHLQGRRKSLRGQTSKQGREPRERTRRWNKRAAPRGTSGSVQLTTRSTRPSSVSAEALRQGKPEDLVRYLRFWGSFHRYSYHNAMLILSQNPDATHVAGFHRWRKVGRYVRKGEHGIAILYPRIRAREDEETGEKERFLSGFGVGYVFDVSATDGAPLPEAPAWRTKGPANPGDVERIVDEIRRQGITVRMGRAAVEERIPGADGVTYREGDAVVIAARDDFDPAHTVHTLLHEFAHATLHLGTDRPASREQRELEADAVALAVAPLSVTTSPRRRTVT
jgi:hypothetical protein